MRFLIGVQKKVNSKAGENSHVIPGRDTALVTMNGLPELEIGIAAIPGPYTLVSGRAVWTRSTADIRELSITLSTLDNRSLIQCPTRQLIDQILVILGLQIPPFLIQRPQVVRDIPSVELSHLKPVTHECKPIRIPVFNLKIFVSRCSHHLQEMEAAARPDRSLTVCLALLEPAPTRGGPGGALEEQVRVLAELQGNVHPRTE